MTEIRQGWPTSADLAACGSIDGGRTYGTRVVPVDELADVCKCGHLRAVHATDPIGGICCETDAEGEPVCDCNWFERANS